MSDNIDATENYRALLDAEHAWPCRYMFKFIAPADQVLTVRLRCEGLADLEISERQSKGGKYISLTVACTMDSADAVLNVYGKMKEVPGIIAL